jgi:hypothetical protein
LAVSHTCGACTSRSDCRHSQISLRSRKYQPLATTPCSDAGFPVSMVACAVQVTAGSCGVTAA